ncbi:MAG: xanthan lyase [Paludibacteraceae bacterium]|nr:xanthan lyase [Paludibacteraceae bacterium]
MKRFLLYILFSFCITSSLFASKNINQQQLTDSLRSFASRYAVLEMRVRIKKIQRSAGTVRIETNPALSYLSYTPERVKDLKDMVRRTLGVSLDTKIKIYTDGYEIENLISSQYLPEEKRRTPYLFTYSEQPLTRNLSLPYEVTNGLQNKHIALWASHGRFFDQETNRWKWQRANLLETVEDLLTSSFTMPFLVPMLENAGAIVIQPRERDTQTNEVVMESNEAIGNDKKAWFLPNIPESGNYAVYAWYEQGDNMNDNVVYTIMHGGQETKISVNQHIGGHTWIYLGTYFFEKGQDEHNGVRITNLGNLRTNRLQHCRMKFGGGMGDIPRFAKNDTAPATTSQLPRWMEGSRYWLQYAGIPDSVFLFSEGKSDYTDDFTSRGRWVNYICGGSVVNPDNIGLKIPINLGLAFHTDAGTCLGDTTIGTLTIYTIHDNDKHTTTPIGTSRMTIRDYADYVQTQVVEDIRRVYAPEWNRRELRNSSYSETRNPVVPTIILESLSHQNIADMRYGHDPRFKFLLARAVYKGIAKYLAEQENTTYTIQPLPVNSFAIERRNDNLLHLSWKATTDTLEPTAKPTFYIVYERTDGDWSQGMKTTQNYIDLPITKGKLTEYKVVAGNDGGISLPSETLAAHIHPKEKGTALIINGFTRLCAPDYIHFNDTLNGFDNRTLGIAYQNDISFTGFQYEFNRTLKWKTDDDPGFGASHQNYNATLEKGNTFDYPTTHGQAIAQAGYSFVSQSLASVQSNIDPARYAFVDVILGKQKTTTLGTQKITTDYFIYPDNLKNALTRYAQQHGKILLSGAYIATDIFSNAQSSPTDQLFAQQVLHYQTQPNATTSATIHNQTTTYTLLTQPNETRIPAEHTDAIMPYGDNTTPLLFYQDQKSIAAIYHCGNHQTIVLAFPIESLQTQQQIDDIIKHSINIFEQ